MDTTTTGQYVMLGPPGQRFMAVRGTDESRWRVSAVIADARLNMGLYYKESFEHMWQVHEYVKRETQ